MKKDDNNPPGQLGQTVPLPGITRCRRVGRGAEPASGFGLSNPVYLPGIYIALSRDRSAGLRAYRDRLCTRPFDCREQISQTLYGFFPQSRGLP